MDLEKKIWTLIEYSSNDDFIPRGRAWHSACKIKEEIFYIGGMLKNQEFTNEVNFYKLYIFILFYKIITYNIFSSKWRQIYIDESINPIFKPRCSHISILKDNNLYIMGGLGKADQYIEDFNTEKKEVNVKNSDILTLGFSHIIKVYIYMYI